MYVHSARMVDAVVVHANAVITQVLEDEFRSHVVDLENEVGVATPSVESVTDVERTLLDQSVPTGTGHQAGGEGAKAGADDTANRVITPATCRRHGYRGGHVDLPRRGHGWIEQAFVIVEEIGTRGTREVIGVP